MLPSPWDIIMPLLVGFTISFVSATATFLLNPLSTRDVIDIVGTTFDRHREHRL